MSTQRYSSRIARRSALALSVGLGLCAGSAWATHGMNLDAYGARAGGMGGASFAYDSGNSAVMNNPATLGLREGTRNDLGVGLSVLSPRVSSYHPMAGSVGSSGTNYYMPSISFIRTQDRFSFGAAMNAQGGMGTEYGAGSSLFAGGMSMMGKMAMLSGEEVRSELSVGRLMFPLAYKVNDRLSVAAQLDFVWAGFDLKMDMDGRSFGSMVQSGRASGSMVNAFQGAMQQGMVRDVNYARFDFSDSSDFTGKANNTGFAGKLGLVFKASDRISIGATYHSKTKLGDLEAGGSTVTMGVDTPMGAMAIPVTGTVKVIDFQWPETYGVGVAFQATDRLMLVADIKQLKWSKTMENFVLGFTADAAQGNPMAAGFGGTSMTASMAQNWDDQTVFAFGGEYKLMDNLALRAGFSLTDNPIPDSTLNPLFPAITKNHMTLGLGYRFNKAHSLAAAVSYAPRVQQTNSENGITSSHSQTNWRINYNYTF